jgi:hypothetical protein
MRKETQKVAFISSYTEERFLDSSSLTLASLDQTHQTNRRGRLSWEKERQEEERIQGQWSYHQTIHFVIERTELMSPIFPLCVEKRVPSLLVAKERLNLEDTFPFSLLSFIIRVFAFTTQVSLTRVSTSSSLCLLHLLKQRSHNSMTT